MIQKNIDASVIFHAIKLSETWKKNGEAITRRYGITVQQWFILLLLANDPNIIYLQQHPQRKPLMAKELAEALNVTRANITNLLNVLMAKGLVLQVTDAEDRRRKRLTLSAGGKRLVLRIEKVRSEFNERLLSRFSRKDKEQFIQFSEACLLAMAKGRDEA
jgi:DNA-binding MarR family transcriptional regulator